ncbi:unnamed protein product, partial [Effrenium voratum]
AVLRGLDARDAALVVLAEHTLSSAAVGECSVWALRAGQLLASCGAGKAQHSVGSHLRSFTLCLRPGDLVALAPKSTASLEEAALVLRCELMRPQDAWSPLQTEAEGPHPSWAKTIFNECAVAPRSAAFRSGGFMLSSCLDWPLSQAEKRGRLLQLYDKDVQAAERLLKTLEPSQAGIGRKLGHVLVDHVDELDLYGRACYWYDRDGQRLASVKFHSRPGLAAASAEPAAVSEPAPAAVSCRPSILRARSEEFRTPDTKLARGELRLNMTHLEPKPPKPQGLKEAKRVCAQPGRAARGVGAPQAAQPAEGSPPRLRVTVRLKRLTGTAGEARGHRGQEPKRMGLVAGPEISLGEEMPSVGCSCPNLARRGPNLDRVARVGH